jgi:8-oxo-dGTP pyrophosphatase MutT (NUDIX family)
MLWLLWPPIRDDLVMDISTVSSRVVYENQWMRVREDQVRRADGTEGLYGVVEKVNFALVVPFDGSGFWLVEQFRYPVGRRYWEFPQGSWEEDHQAEPQELARGELKEETGLSAGKMRHLGFLHQAYGVLNHGFDVWLATELTRGEARRTAEEQDMRAARFSIDQWQSMVRSGQVRDAGSIAAYALLDLIG